jgi:hypothetical protein
MTAHVPAIPNFLPIGPVLFGMFLGWRSHRAAVCPALGVFLLVYFTISAITGRPPANDAFGQVFYPAVTVLPPVNFIILTFLADQDFFSRRGLLRMFIILAKTGAIYWLTLSSGPAIGATYHSRR